MKRKFLISAIALALACGMCAQAEVTQLQPEAQLTENIEEQYIEISHGDKGDHVVRLQEKLTEAGYFTGKISGKYDTATEKAVKKFQKENGLKANGTATAETQKLLFAETEEPAPQLTETPAVVTTEEPAVDPTEVPAVEATVEPTEVPSPEQYAAFNYDLWTSSPDAVQGRSVRISGTAVQSVGNSNTGMRIRLAIDDTQNMVFVTVAHGISDVSISAGDTVTVCGTLKGIYTYTDTDNTSVSIPHVWAEIVNLR